MKKDQLSELAAATAHAMESSNAATAVASEDGSSANLDRVYLRVGLLRRKTLRDAGI